MQVEDDQIWPPVRVNSQPTFVDKRKDLLKISKAFMILSLESLWLIQNQIYLLRCKVSHYQECNSMIYCKHKMSSNVYNNLLSMCGVLKVTKITRKSNNNKTRL